VSRRLRYFAIAALIASVPFALGLLASRSESARARPGEILPSLAQMVVAGAVAWYPWAFAAPFIDRRVRLAPPKGAGPRWRPWAGHALICLAFGVGHGVLVWTTAALLQLPDRTPFVISVVRQLVPDTLLYAALTAAFTIAESRRRQTEIAERLRAEVAEARLDALRQQLNPHFLFNTLNHIVMQLRSGEVPPALRMLLALSDLLHDVLRERAQLITLADELRIVERYLEIERERFGDRLDAELTFEPKTLDALVPTLILQPLIENATRHGISADDGRCRLRVTARLDAGRVCIEVQDDGPGLVPAGTPAPGIGLSNTRERLRYLYGDTHTFDVRTLDDGGVRVSISFPFQR
jgi:anti-sigma regulatory factor (Ser/Thr protein kinase)